MVGSFFGHNIFNWDGACGHAPRRRGSHKLPYFLNSDYDNEGSVFRIGRKSYKAYEEFLENKVGELGLEKEIFRAKKGDLLIWHANILHGGEPHLDKTRTRKSLVYHYFDENSVCYHEVTQRPALFELQINNVNSVLFDLLKTC